MCIRDSVSAGLDGCDVTVSAELVNTGEEFAASELVQVYVTRPEGDLTRPVSFLDCFQKSRLLAPGESQTVTLDVYKRQVRTHTSTARVILSYPKMEDSSTPAVRRFPWENRLFACF